jgi:hypothetical protein
MTVFKTLQVYDAQMFLQGMTNKVRCTFSVSDTTRAVHNQYIARQLELVTLYTIFSVPLWPGNAQQLLLLFWENGSCHPTEASWQVVTIQRWR